MAGPESLRWRHLDIRQPPKLHRSQSNCPPCREARTANDKSKNSRTPILSPPAPPPVRSTRARPVPEMRHGLADAPAVAAELLVPVAPVIPAELHGIGHLHRHHQTPSGGGGASASGSGRPSLGAQSRWKAGVLWALFWRKKWTYRDMRYGALTS